MAYSAFYFTLVLYVHHGSCLRGVFMPDGSAFSWANARLTQEGKREMRSHLSHYFCLEITHITLAHIPFAFVFNKIVIYNPPAWRTGGVPASHTFKPGRGRRGSRILCEGGDVLRVQFPPLIYPKSTGSL